MSILDLISGALENLGPGSANAAPGGDFNSVWDQIMADSRQPLKDDSRLPQGLPQTAMPFADTDIVPREPINIPLPQGRPMGAPGMEAPPILPMGAPPDAGGMPPMAPPMAPPAGGGLLPGTGASRGGLAELIFGPGNADGVRRFSRSLAGGFNAPSSPFKGGAIMSGAGGAMAGGNKYEDDEHTRQVQALDRVFKARQIGSQEEYDKARSDYYRTYAGTRQQDADTRRQRAGSARPDAKTALELDRREQAWIKQADAVIEQTKRDFTLTPEQRAAKVQQIEGARDRHIKQLRDRIGIDRKPQAAQKPATAEETPTIEMEGGGAKDDPYKPTTPDDYEEIPPGAYYIHPSDGKLRLKK